jgi:hypothetical protein
MCFFLFFFTCPRLVAAYQLRDGFFFKFLSQSDEGLFFSHNQKIENERSESFFSLLCNMLNLYTATQSLVYLYKCSVKKKYISGHTGPALKLFIMAISFTQLQHL